MNEWVFFHNLKQTFINHIPSISIIIYLCYDKKKIRGSLLTHNIPMTQEVFSNLLTGLYIYDIYDLVISI